MKIQGMADPGKFTVEQIPGTNRNLVRLSQNVKPAETEELTGYEYDEYHVEVETWDGIVRNVRDNCEEFLKKGMNNEIDLSNEALYRAQEELTSYVELASAIWEGVNGVDWQGSCADYYAGIWHAPGPGFTGGLRRHDGHRTV